MEGLFTSKTEVLWSPLSCSFYEVSEYLLYPHTQAGNEAIDILIVLSTLFMFSSLTRGNLLYDLQLIVSTIFGVIVGGLYFDLGTDSLGFSDR